MKKLLLSLLVVASSVFGQGGPYGTTLQLNQNGTIKAPTNFLEVNGILTTSDGVSWDDISDKPTTAAGFGIENGDNIDLWGAKTVYAGSLIIGSGKTVTINNTITLSGTDSSTLNIGSGGTLGTAAFTPATNYATPSYVDGQIETLVSNPAVFDLEGNSTAWKEQLGYIESTDVYGGATSSTAGQVLRRNLANTGYEFTNPSNITNLNASNLTTGVVSAARGGSGSINGVLKADGGGTVTQAGLSDYFNIGSGTLVSITPNTSATNADVRLVAKGNGGVGLLTSTSSTFILINDANGIQSVGNWTNEGLIEAYSFSGDGSSITSLNASNLASGTVPTARLNRWDAGASTDLNITPTGSQTNISLSLQPKGSGSVGMASPDTSSYITISDGGGIVSEGGWNHGGSIVAYDFSGVGTELTDLNANNINSGVLGKPYGGAGDINGVLKANGSGVVSKAGQADYFSLPTGENLLDISPTGISANIHINMQTKGLGVMTFSDGSGNGIMSFSPTGRIFYDAFGSDSIDAANRVLVNASTTTVFDWQNQALKDDSGNNSINWTSRRAYNISGLNTIDWDNGFLLDTDEVTSVSWVARILYNLSGVATVGYDSQVLYNPAGYGWTIYGSDGDASAPAGAVGEVIQTSRSIGSATALGDKVNTNCLSISLTAGDWDVSGILTALTGSMSTGDLYQVAGKITVSSEDLSDDGTVVWTNFEASAPQTDSSTSVSIPPKTIRVIGTTTVYGVIYADFNGDSGLMYGSLRARRMR